jgi:DNA mismatch repair protein MutS
VPGRQLRSEPELEDLLLRALEEALPQNLNDGAVVRPGFDPRLDELRASISDAQRWISDLERQEREATGIKSLKVGFNRVFGYYLEVSNASAIAPPPSYQRKQTLAGAERYVTAELKEKESIVLNGEQAILAREKDVFAELCAAVAARAASLIAAAEAIGVLDAILSLATAAIEHDWRRPELDDSLTLTIRKGRHPLVEHDLGPGRFTPNDTDLEQAARMIVLTGPNMAGKSTYLRQVGLIVIMAQAGSFVPAEEARIGVADRVFTRVGAQDAIASGLSTFMVEMVETAAILHGATRQSLVILDEIGRGTSTYDGMSIAQAVMEYLHESPQLQCRSLLATHFHELTALAEKLSRVRNYRVEVSEEGGRVTFLHRIVPGGADRSYGIHVAEIAGLPAQVTMRAREVLQALETARPLSPGEPRSDREQLQLPIVAQHPLVRELELIDVDHLTPVEALNRLAVLKQMGRQGTGSP